jgi:uncharacterized protein Yka (UPF0111/DUF47 family)
MKEKLIFTNSDLKESLGYLIEVNDVESDVADLTNRLDDLTDVVDDDLSRMSYVRQLTAEFLELLITLTGELQDQNIKLPQTQELMSKISGREGRKKYYMSKFRL